MIIFRDFTRNEHDDFVINVSDRVSEVKEVLELRVPEGELIGWKIQSRYE